MVEHALAGPRTQARRCQSPLARHNSSSSMSPGELRGMITKPSRFWLNEIRHKHFWPHLCHSETTLRDSGATPLIGDISAGVSSHKTLESEMRTGATEERPKKKSVDTAFPTEQSDNFLLPIRHNHCEPEGLRTVNVADAHPLAVIETTTISKKKNRNSVRRDSSSDHDAALPTESDAREIRSCSRSRAPTCSGSPWHDTAAFRRGKCKRDPSACAMTSSSSQHYSQVELGQ